VLDPGTALLAPGGQHLRVADNGHAQLTEDAEIGGLRPRADLTIKDAARVWGERTLLVVLTGMGNDGLAGATELQKRGGRILAEAETSCTVYGMPRAIVEAKLADDVLPLDELADAIRSEAG
jgi:two-component system chemotaxis response regulator CheB